MEEIINELLFENDVTVLWSYPKYEWAFFVHASIIESVYRNFNDRVRTIWNIYELELKIGRQCYDMRWIILKPGTHEKLQFLYDSIKYSQFSFPWRDNPTLFINVEHFHILQQFIEKNNLAPYILNIEEEPGITATNEMIKVVTFNKCVNNLLDLVAKYYTYLHVGSTEICCKHRYFYMTFAYPWLQPLNLQHFHMPVDNDFYKAFHAFLYHIGTLNYTNQLTIMDLIRIRHAICDYRNPYPSNLVKYELDFMIKKKLVEMQQIHLDLDDEDYDKHNFFTNYLVCEFQHFFENLATDKIVSIVKSLTLDRTRTIIDLEDSDKLLKTSGDLQFNINGTSYEKMSLPLFLELVERDNVFEIRLNTNNVWINDECQLNRSFHNAENQIHVHLIGENTYNFIENFVSSLKRVTISTGRFVLHIYCILTDYSIFDDLVLSPIKFYDIKIDTNMLNGLHKSNLKSAVVVHNGTFENTPHNWALLNKLTKLTCVEIQEDDGTWANLFEFIEHDLVQSKSREFQFEHTRVVFKNESVYITNLKFIKFIFDDLNTKLELYDMLTNEIVDLYYLKFQLEPDDKSVYEFYQ